MRTKPRLNISYLVMNENMVSSWTLQNILHRSIRLATIEKGSGGSGAEIGNVALDVSATMGNCLLSDATVR